MNQVSTSTAIPTRALKLEAMSSMSASFELFCLASGMEALGEMMDVKMHRRSVVHAMQRGRDRRKRTAEENQGQDRLPWRQGGYHRAAPASAASTERSIRCRAGKRRLRRTGSASGP